VSHEKLERPYRYGTTAAAPLLPNAYRDQR
jgi:hypothetical protein